MHAAASGQMTKVKERTNTPPPWSGDDQYFPILALFACEVHGLKITACLNHEPLPTPSPPLVVLKAAWPLKMKSQ